MRTSFQRYVLDVSVARIVRAAGLGLVGLLLLDQMLAFPRGWWQPVAVGSACHCPDCLSGYPISYKFRLPDSDDFWTFGTYTGIQGPIVVFAVGAGIYLLGRCIRVESDFTIEDDASEPARCDCGYSTAGLKADAVCPECGHALTRKPADADKVA